MLKIEKLSRSQKDLIVQYVEWGVSNRINALHQEEIELASESRPNRFKARNLKRAINKYKKILEAVEELQCCPPVQYRRGVEVKHEHV